MLSYEKLQFRIASNDYEFDKVFDLNYRTFVEEIPQHPPNEEKRLIDRFHDENTYLIGLLDEELIGMVAVRDKRPFSLDEKVEELDSYLPEHNSVSEVRLLVVEKKHRHTEVFLRLFQAVQEYILQKGYDLVLISGISHLVPLYKEFGFVPFGSEVGTPGAMYQPMYITFDAAADSSSKYYDKTLFEKKNISFVPGPINVDRSVLDAFQDIPISHRGKEFKSIFENVKRKLCHLVNARDVEILVGTGSLANDVMAAQISLVGGKGLVLSNGEFGDRLSDHAERFTLDFEVYKTDWGSPFDLNEISKMVNKGNFTWLWFVHCETSTGVLNDLDGIKRICSDNDIRLYLDSVSSIGNIEVDLSGVELASSVSGKGLGSFSGLSMVFRNVDVEPNKRIPRYLDLGYYVSQGGLPFTQSSNLVLALKAALDQIESEDLLEYKKRITDSLRTGIGNLGFEVLNGDDETACPGVITLSLSEEMDSKAFGEDMEKRGFKLNYESDYLLARNLVQVCPMGRYSEKELADFLEALGKMRE